MPSERSKTRSNEVEFPDPDSNYLSDEDCLSFRALLEGEPITCLVTAKFLMIHFGASDLSEEELRQAFSEHRTEIERIVREQIANGWIDDQRRIILRARVTKLRVTFDEGLRKGPEGLAMANEANKILIKLIGPTAEDVILEWDGAVEADGVGRISLLISDPTSDYSVKKVLDAKQWERVWYLSLNLGSIWGAILRGRSQKLLLQSG